MSESSLRMIKRINEFIPKADISRIPKGLRGIYVLYLHDKKKNSKNVVYIGLARNGFKGRLWSHNRDEEKSKKWNCCSIYEVWDNVRDEEIIELEGLFRHIYRKDSEANSLNIQGSYKKLKSLEEIKLNK